MCALLPVYARPESGHPHLLIPPLLARQQAGLEGAVRSGGAGQLDEGSAPSGPATARADIEAAHCMKRRRGLGHGRRILM